MKEQLLLLLLLVATSLAQPVPCSGAYQCVRNSNFNYVDCVNGFCQCKEANGFTGNATASDPCRCDGVVYWGQNGHAYCKNCTSPSSIFYDDEGTPRCADVAACEEEDIRSAHQRSVIYKLYSQLVYPQPLLIMQDPSQARSLFADQIFGRITPVGVFSDFEGTLEYFYALAAAPGGSVESVKFIDLFSVGKQVAVRVDILFNTTTISGPQLYNLTETGFFFFDDEGLISSYDLAILRLGKYADVSTAAHPLYINQVCQVAQTFCNSTTNEQYATQDECESFLNGIPFGSWNDAQSNTVVCRVLHSILVPFRPDYHCMHIGPSGGGKCVDVTYESWYNILS